MVLLIAILLTVTLQSPFGEAGAQVLGTPAARTFDLTVHVEGTPAAVIARMTGVAGELDPVAMVPRGSGIYGQVVRVTAWENLSISFEYITAEGETTISSPSTLSALGVEVDGVTPTASAPPPVVDTGLDPLLLAGVAAALGAVVIMGFWASGALSDVFQSKPSEWTYAAAAGLPDKPPEDDPEPAEEPVNAEDSADQGGD